MTAGPVHPADLAAWRRWQRSRQPVRRLAGRARRIGARAPEGGEVELLSTEGADVLVAVEAAHASVRHAVVTPLSHLDPRRVSLVGPPGWDPPPAYAGHRRQRVPVDRLASLVPRPVVALACGHFTPVGAAAYAVAVRSAAPYLVVQHGALTPYVPPLPPDARLLAWTDSDARFWGARRPDVETRVVGAQLLWQAAGSRTAAATPTADPAPTYLGQLHAAELSRPRLAAAATAFCRRHAVAYRPHPSEADLASRAIHRGMRWAGIPVDEDGLPLAESDGPVVSVFSTGVLEAAARGRDAWVAFPRPPAWLEEFWERYGMRRYGGPPTPAPEPPPEEPARAVARAVEEHL